MIELFKELRADHRRLGLFFEPTIAATFLVFAALWFIMTGNSAQPLSKLPGLVLLALAVWYTSTRKWQWSGILGHLGLWEFFCGIFATSPFLVLGYLASVVFVGAITLAQGPSLYVVAFIALLLLPLWVWPFWAGGSMYFAHLSALEEEEVMRPKPLRVPNPLELEAVRALNGIWPWAMLPDEGIQPPVDAFQYPWKHDKILQLIAFIRQYVNEKDENVRNQVYRATRLVFYIGHNTYWGLLAESDFQPVHVELIQLGLVVPRLEVADELQPPLL